MGFVRECPGAIALAVATLLMLSTAAAIADPTAEPLGPACADYAARSQIGPRSGAGAAQQPLTVTASETPQLNAFSAALSGKLNPAVNLIDTLNADTVTVFAPTDNAFSRLPPETTAALQTDPALLTRLLTYQVIPGRWSPTSIVGTHQTLQGGELTVTGAPDRLWVDDALVLCGGIPTSNATLYLIDTVLTPPPGP